jgi:hypothetical protein
MGRVIAWFSCGAASAVAAKMATEKYGSDCTVAYCDTMASEHPDNARFFTAVQSWLGVTVQRLAPLKYTTIDEVFAGERYMSGIAGAKCTVEMKKRPRFAFQQPDDIHVFGLTADESRRIARFAHNNHDLRLEWLLLGAGITKAQCLEVISSAGIKLPAMYALGYRNNNCLGCVKATGAHYWNSIRRDFPEVFGRRATQSRELGVRLTRLRGKRIFLDELPESYMDGKGESVSCGPECGQQADLFATVE